MTVVEPPSYKVHRSAVVACVVVQLAILGFGLAGRGPLAALGAPTSTAITWTSDQLGSS